MGSPTPIAATMGSSNRTTSRAPARIAGESNSTPFHFSDSGDRDYDAGCNKGFLAIHLVDEIAQHGSFSKSAITPSFIRRILGSCYLVYGPTSFGIRSHRTDHLGGGVDGHRWANRTMPFSLEKTSVFAVPRSIPISLESKPNTVIRWLRKLLARKVH